MKTYKQLLAHALSDGEIKDFFMDEINILKYSELSKYDHIDDVLGPCERCVILFESEQLNKGHWCLIHIVRIAKRKPYLEFFDPYGVPDNEFDYIPKSFQNYSKQKR